MSTACSNILEPGDLHEACNRSAREVISRLKILGKLDIAERRRPQDGSFRVKVDRKGKQRSVDLRVSVIPSHYGESVVLRILDGQNAPSSIDQLVVPAAGHREAAAAAESSERDPARHRPDRLRQEHHALRLADDRVYRPGIRILTAEDPIEYIFDNFSQSEVNEQIGNTFASLPARVPAPRS